MENYRHKYGLPPFTIDFRDTAPSFLNKVVKPLQANGHKVDLFLFTYPHDNTSEMKNLYQPVHIHWKNYEEIPLGIAQTLIGEPMLVDQHLECIDGVEAYEKKEEILYDQIIITRFDLYYYQSILDAGIDWDKPNYPFVHFARSPTGTIFSSEDNFICYPRSKNDLFKECLMAMKKDKHSTHLSGKYFIDRGETVKYLFGQKGDGAYDYPFYKFGRHLFGAVKEYTLEDILRIPMNRVGSSTHLYANAALGLFR